MSLSKIFGKKKGERAKEQCLNGVYRMVTLSRDEILSEYEKSKE